jgi:hypothetical protein
LIALWRGCQHNPGTGYLADPFAVNPIRRSFVLVLGCAAIIVGPNWIGGEAAMTTVMLSVGWLAVTGFVLGLPVLVWSLAEAGMARVKNRLQPSLEQLDLSPRVLHVLQRHGYDTIESVETASDSALLMLSNMDQRGLREVRRAIALWRYRRWQERGFPAARVG